MGCRCGVPALNYRKLPFFEAARRAGDANCSGELKASAINVDKATELSAGASRLLFHNPAKDLTRQWYEKKPVWFQLNPGRDREFRSIVEQFVQSDCCTNDRL